MFEVLLFLAAGIAILGTLIALDGSRDVLHPLVFIGPMLAFLYAYMPSKIGTDGLLRYFDADQLVFIQTLNVLGIAAFVIACLSVGLRVPEPEPEYDTPTFDEGVKPALTPKALNRLLIGSAILGSIGLGCWLITIINVGGFVQAFSNSYSGGWDDSGYIRDGNLLLLVGVLLAVSALASKAPPLPCFILAATFGLPWTAQALLMARRGPTFAIVITVMMGWYLVRKTRPPVIATALLGVALGWLVLFLVTNRGSIYLGSDFDVTTDVSNVVEKPDTGNEYIYGTGSVIAAERRDHYFWMRRYLAEILVRPVPRAIWPTKYEDFGVPELLNNAGTGEGFADALGWVGAVGSAPGVIADLWVEAWWFAVPLMALLGWSYGWVWKKAVTKGGPWTSQYAILSALSIYLVMQTMEAVIFRTIMLSLPCWIVWRWAIKARQSRLVPVLHTDGELLHLGGARRV